MMPREECRAKIFIPTSRLSIVPAKNIAAVLNNESNLRILENLKIRPFYPRELAGEMGLSEPFIVRRLKAMEEHGIVEGRWETEKNGRKVKRYYLKDITMQLGKNGLQVKSGEKPEKKTIDTNREIIRSIVYLPTILFVASGFLLVQPVILVVSGLFFTWQLAINVAFYRTYRHKTMLNAILLLTVGIISVLTFIWLYILHNTVPTQASAYVGLIYFFIGLIFFTGVIRHIRFSQIEGQDILDDKRELVKNLDSAPIPLKIFYLPLVIRLKLNEYFGLI